METSPAVSDVWKVLLLRPEAYDSIGRSRTGLWFSLRLFVLAGLIASIGLLSTGLAQAGQLTFSDRLAAAATSLTSVASGLPQRWTPRLAEALTAAAGRLQGAAAAIQSVQPPLGSSTSEVLRALGAWASQPALALTAWMTAMLPLLLAARWMGGRGSLRRQVSLLLLAFLPQALAFLSSIALEPVSPAAALATALRLLTGLWSLAIVVTALGAANRFTRGQAAKVVLVTVVALAAIAAVVGVLVDRLAGPILTMIL